MRGRKRTEPKPTQPWLLEATETENGERRRVIGEARKWLLDPGTAVEPPRKTRSERFEQEGNGRAPNEAAELRELEGLAEIQKIEISVLVRRVEELESELSAAKREAANAKREATRAKKASATVRSGTTRAKPAKAPPRSRAVPRSR
jgi:hypothetical protein